MIRKYSMGILVSMVFLMGCPSGQAQDNNKAKVELGAKQPPVLNAANKQILGDFRNAIADMVDQVIPTIVSIRTEAFIQGGPEAVDPFEYFFGPGFAPRGAPQQPREMPRQEGLGSGVIVSKDGYILTNNHVVAGTDKITVTLSDQREYSAKIVGTDSLTDVAVIKLEKAPSDLPVAFIGKSESLRVGEWIVAVGNPFGLSKTVTTGIVSAKEVHDRGITSYENFIQTDAAINPGNSGGGMFNLAGELVGINTAILSRTGGFQGIGFAIPIDLAHAIVDEILQYGTVTRGWLGISIQNVDQKIAKAMKLDGVRGALVAEVLPETPASKGGLLAGDVILSVNGKTVRDANSLRNEIAMVRPGTKVALSLIRFGKTMVLQLQMGSKEASAKASGDDAQDLGMGLTPSQDGQGVVVSSLKPDGPAFRAGFRSGDVLLEINRNAVNSIAGVQAILKKEAKSSALLFLVVRGNGRLFIVLEKG